MAVPTPRPRASGTVDKKLLRVTPRMESTCGGHGFLTKIAGLASQDNIKGISVLVFTAESNVFIHIATNV